jgi:hypothetical protein
MSLPSIRQGRVLAIECATEACSVALFDDGALVAGSFANWGAAMPRLWCR